MSSDSNNRNHQPEWLIVGLGNPGSRYAFTRHNIGWLVCEELVRKHSATWVTGRGEWRQATIAIGNTTVVVLLPTTYMNNSGKAVAEAQRLFRVPSHKVLVIVDEYNFPVGKIHLKGQGSDGGHNGVASVINEIETKEFWRLRCGIDRNFSPGGLVEYVLSPFAPEEEPSCTRMIGDAIHALHAVVEHGAQRAMTMVNTPINKTEANGTEPLPTE